MAEPLTVEEGVTTLAHPTVFPHQVSELSEQEQRQRLDMARFQCWKKITTQPVVLKGPFCNRTWDNVMCWPDTAAGTVSYQPCPAYINRFDQAEYATKHCLDNGTWYIKPEMGRPWTNFSACIRKPNKETLPELIVEHMPGIKLMYTIGYSLSLAALILAVTIMIYFRRLHCPRNMIHLNMFVAFLLRAAFSLMKNVLLVNDLGFPIDVNNTGHRIEFIQEGTHWECKLFFTLFYYIIFASLMGLFNEGLYLVLILTVSVFAEKTKVRWFVLLGWGIPVIFVIPWVVCRILFDDMLCWNVHMREEFFWILRGPYIASVAVNFLFFINIVRLLFTKLTASNCPESKKVRYRKLAKSTLILIPLFAVYYMGFIWLPDGLSPASDLFKIYVEMLFNSFQGFLVALLFCFLNAEVQNELRKEWQRRVQHKDQSWRSQPSMGSFLHRSGLHKDGPGPRPSHTRSFLDSDSQPSTGLLPASGPCTPAKHNGHALVPICEESAPLTRETASIRGEDRGDVEEEEVMGEKGEDQRGEEAGPELVAAAVVCGRGRQDCRQTPTAPPSYRDATRGDAADWRGDDVVLCDADDVRMCNGSDVRVYGGGDGDVVGGEVSLTSVVRGADTGHVCFEMDTGLGGQDQSDHLVTSAVDTRS